VQPVALKQKTVLYVPQQYPNRCCI